MTCRYQVTLKEIFKEYCILFGAESLEQSNVGFGSLHTAAILFEGIFQLRLATDVDPSDELRGKLGWTFAYDEESDLDRIIRFNYPIAERSFVDNVGVFVKSAYLDGQYIDDSLIGQMVNLGSQSYFDGTAGANGREPIINFELHVGNDNDYICGRSNMPPVGNGAFAIRPELAAELGLGSMIKLKALKESRKQALQSTGNSIDRQRLVNIDRSLNFGVLMMQVDYNTRIDELILNPYNSEVVKIIYDKAIRNLLFRALFYSFDGDGLIGHVRGEIVSNFR
jgi:hypothetical protein